VVRVHGLGFGGLGFGVCVQVSGLWVESRVVWEGKDDDAALLSLEPLC